MDQDAVYSRPAMRKPKDRSGDKRHARPEVNVQIRCGEHRFSKSRHVPRIWADSTTPGLAKHYVDTDAEINLHDKQNNAMTH